MYICTCYATVIHWYQYLFLSFCSLISVKTKPSLHEVHNGNLLQWCNKAHFILFFINMKQNCFYLDLSLSLTLRRIIIRFSLVSFLDILIKRWTWNIKYRKSEVRVLCRVVSIEICNKLSPDLSSFSTL